MNNLRKLINSRARLVLMIGLALSIISADAYAQAYRYRDRRGNVRFTDNAQKAGLTESEYPSSVRIYPATVKQVVSHNRLITSKNKIIELIGVGSAVKKKRPKQTESDENSQQNDPARQFLIENVKDHSVYCWEETPESTGRPAKVYMFLGQDRLINAEMIQKGLAIHQPDAGHRYEKLFTRLMNQAREESAGVWKKFKEKNSAKSE